MMNALMATKSFATPPIEPRIKKRLPSAQHSLTAQWAVALLPGLIRSHPKQVQSNQGLTETMGSALSSNANRSLDRYKDTIGRLLHRKKKAKEAAAGSSIWQQELQPIFKGQEPRSRGDEQYNGESSFDQSQREERAQEEAQYHYLRLLAALNRHQHRPTPPRCLIEQAEEDNTSCQSEANAALEEGGVGMSAVLLSTPPSDNGPLLLRR